MLITYITYLVIIPHQAFSIIIQITGITGIIGNNKFIEDLKDVT